MKAIRWSTPAHSTPEQYLKRERSLKQAKIYWLQILDLDLCWRTIEESGKRIFKRSICFEPNQYYRVLSQEEKTGKTRVIWRHHEEDLSVRLVDPECKYCGDHFYSFDLDDDVCPSCKISREDGLP